MSSPPTVAPGSIEGHSPDPSGSVESTAVLARPPKRTGSRAPHPILLRVHVFVGILTVGEATSEIDPTNAGLSDLLLGPVGRVYSELSASWLPVLVPFGLALWVARRRADRGSTAAPPGTRAPALARMARHRAVGIGLSVR